MTENRSALLKKTVIAVILLLAAAGAVFYTFNSSKNETSQFVRKKSIVGVKVASVERRDLSDVRVFSGTLEAEKKYDAAAKVGGRIQEIAVNLGDCLKRGALIARLDSEEYEQQLAQTMAELDVARASLLEAQTVLTAAERNYQRAGKLREQKVSSVAEMEAAETDRLSKQARVNLVEAQIKQRQAAVKATEVRLSYTTLTADWQADETDACRYVAARYVDEGDTIAANARVVTLVDLSLLKAVITVAERDYGFLKAGQSAEIRVDLINDRTFPGSVVRMAPIFDKTSRQARIEIAVENPDRLLKGGMFARVHIELSKELQVLSVPSSAIVQRGEIYGVFVVEDDIARFVEVKPGIEETGWIHVSGVKEGQNVVTLGHHLLSDGVPVSTSDGSTGESPKKKRK